MLTFRTFDEANTYFHRLPISIEITRATVRGSALTIGRLVAKAITGTEEDYDEFHVAYYIENDNLHGIAGLFFDEASQRWTVCTEL
jgi:hypothetical protein